MISSYRQAHLEAESMRGSEVDPLLSGHYDALVLASSWDTRCLTITQSTALSAQRVITLIFNAKDDLGLRDQHDIALRSFASSRGKEQCEIVGDSVDTSGVWAKLSQAIVDVYKLLRRPVRLLIDISTCPRIYSAAVLACTLGGGLAREITLFYSEGAYATASGLIPETFTAGKWRMITVPGLNGKPDPGKSRFFLVSVGFEGSKTYQAVRAADPSRVSLLFPEPGYVAEYTNRAREVNAALIREYCIPADQIVRAPAGDAVAAWRALAESPRERPDVENTYYVCCGTKPHAIALTLRAMALRYPTVLYNVPGEHRVIPTRSSGVLWRYIVRDLSAMG